MNRRAEPAEELSRRLLAGDRLALTRLMSGVEAGRSNARAALRCLYSRTGRAHVVGVTGPPGSGKSTLTTRLAEVYRRRGATVGIVAIDPTSPFTGGALLGDRIRMMDLHSDPGVFVRSMATRGVVGGVASTTGDMVVLLDAFGKDVILVETVGVGQDEVEIARTADTTLVVGVPGLGDDIQALKAGILEIADILVVNKADLDGAHRLVQELRMAQSLGEAKPWPVPIQETVATDGTGVVELLDQIRAIVEDHVTRRFDALADADRWREQFAAVAGRERDPYAVAEQMLDEVVRGDG